MNVNATRGLNQKQVMESRIKSGNNKLPQGEALSWLKLLLNQFLNPLIIILLVACLVTLLLGEYVDCVVILAVILINSALGFVQENKVQKTLESLQSVISSNVEVKRDGVSRLLPIEELVVGDIVNIKMGDKLAADGVLIKARGLSANESALTGESLPVTKVEIDKNEKKNFDTDRHYKKESKLYMGTSIMSGYGAYIVTSVGTSTEFGGIASSIALEKETKTPLQKKLEKFSISIAIFVIAASFLIFAIDFRQEDSDLVHAFEVSMALTVSAIPEALVISVTVILAIGMKRLLRRKALVRKLVVAETLGSVTTICADKTGTLTEGKMRVFQTDFVNEKFAIEALTAANHQINQVDLAIRQWLDENKFSADFDKNEYIDEVTFSSDNKFTVSLHKKRFYFVGAPDMIIEKTDLTESKKAWWRGRVEHFAEKGLKVIGVGYKANKFKQKHAEINDLHDIKWLGVIVLEDPVRKDLKDVIKKTQNAGINIKVITGDHKATALYVMEQIGMYVTSSQVISGSEFDNLTDEQISEELPGLKLLYRFRPEQKYRFVRILQDCGETVAMMGDGINDAPALKKADVGIVVGNATDVSKQTADIVLLDSNFNTIVSAIEEGRGIFENIKKVITYLLSDTFDEIILVGGSILAGLPIPLTPLQILFINLVEDGFPDMALAFEPKNDDLMQRKPRGSKSGLIDKQMKIHILITGFVVDLFLFGLYLLMREMGYGMGEIRSYLFLMLGLDSILYVFSIKSLRKNIWEYNIFNNSLLNLAVIIGLFANVLAFSMPPLRDALELTVPGLEAVILIIFLSLIQVFLIEMIKYFTKRLY